ncbi:MAG: alpha/beta fold hydrolase [Steroidobacteraceae bacterium]|nr:alpha/beta fold hydrolase [Nevskiaceae bacterium]MCP5339927.1 alpha/beta fold hydrolase [Nevskiaceae bacterium]MCP5471016.1 alpha/beta fold hydrolase [Nevskiaceae bacterium]
MATNAITRHFATIEQGRWGPRQVHYRKTGKGPLVILFHQSPLSSRDMIATMERWQQDFTCIAPDTPGFGLSDPLGVPQAEMHDYAEAAVEFMDALGIDKAAVYGFHTGAMISGALAAGFPERVICAAANGYVILTEQERAEIVANYLPAYEPKWDGSHLTWLWARLREQLIFFPWYAKTLEQRLDFDLPPPTALHAGLLDFMRSGDHYRVGYRAAFTMRSDLALQQVKVPILVTAADTDVLAAQLDRVRRPSPKVTVRPGGTPTETLDLCRDFIRKHKPPAAPKLASTRPLKGRLWQQYIDVPGGQLRLRRNDDAAGRPVLVQHDAAGSSEVVQALASGFIGKRPVIALNLPGHGESDNVLPKGKVTVTGYAKAVLAALSALGIEEFDFVGTWGGGLVGLELALLQPTRVGKLVLADMLYFDDKLRQSLAANYTPDIQPVWYGGHLLEAWYLMRDQGLFWPWYERNRQGIIRQPINVDTQMVNRRVFELFRSNGMWRQAYQAHFAYPLQSKLAKSRVPMAFVAPSWDPQLEVTRQAARDFPASPFMLMPDAMEKWADALLPYLDDSNTGTPA